MRGIVVAAIAASLVVVLTGCEEQRARMPDVTGKQLDAAKRALEDAGIRKEAQVDGGGMFGVVREANWEVCEQTPVKGDAVSQAPRLVVARTCDEEPEPAPAKEVSAAKKRAPKQAKPKADRVITPRNSKSLAALLKVNDYCDESIAKFARKHAERTIRFNGSIANMTPHGDAETRFDFLLAPGGKGPASTTGPAFKFEDESVFDLGLTGPDIPDAIGVGDRFRFTTKVREYDPMQCLLFLEPVSARHRP